MRRRRDPVPTEAAEGYELCAMCGEPVLVGADGRCELGHRVRQPVTELWGEAEAEAAEAAAATMPIAAAGLDDPVPEGELREALAGPLDLDAEDATTVELVPAASDGDVSPDTDDEADADARPATDLGDELDW